MMRNFSSDFRQELTALMKWRRDVRHFKTDPIPDQLLTECLDAFSTAPSVGLSQPLRIVQLQTSDSRDRALRNFETANAEALNGYSTDKAALYAGLKLSGMRDAPVQLAIFCDDSTNKGSGLGAKTMPEMRRYSVVSAIMNFWLVTRANGLGLGWVSILDPDQLKRDLSVNTSWSLVAYLCVGWPVEETTTPELEKTGWETRDPTLATVIKR